MRIETREAGLGFRRKTRGGERAAGGMAVMAPVAVVAVVLCAALLYVLARPERPSPVERDPGLSVLVVSIDTLRADALGCYGRARASTPWIDRLAAGGARFETARAHNVVTLPSHANLLSGEIPPRHGVRDNAGFRFPADRPTLATILREKGWRTGAFVSAFPLDSRFGLQRGFEVYDDRLGGEAASAFAMPERPGSRTVAAARRFIETVRDERWLAFVHLYEPHFPYAPPAPFATRFASEPYHGEVAAADAALGPLLAPLLEAGAKGRVLVVLTSDHGESLGEHGEATHGVFAYEATLRVPLVLYAPRLFPGRVVTTPVRHVDVLPTVLDALGLDAPPGLPGRSLLPLARGAGERPGETYFEALSASLDRGFAPLFGLVSDGLKYVDLPLPELYDLRADPGERRNLAASRPRDLERMRAGLARWRSADLGTGGRVREDDAALARLRALGYVTGEDTPGRGEVTGRTYTEDDDPKRLVELDARLESVLSLYHAGNLDGAIAACIEVLRLRPDTPRAHLQLASLERARGRLDAAVAASARAVALRPLDAEAVSLHAVYLTEAGRAREAASLLGRWVVANPPDVDVLTALGVAQARSGRPVEALATFARVRDIDPTNAMALVNAGTVHLAAGDRERARQALEAALDLDDTLARAHNGLGVLAAEEGRWPEAVERWRRATALDPRDYQTLFNLGRTLLRQGRAAEARPYLEAYLRVAPPALEGRDRERVREWLREGR